MISDVWWCEVTRGKNVEVMDMRCISYKYGVMHVMGAVSVALFERVPFECHKSDDLRYYQVTHSVGGKIARKTC